MEGMGLFIDDAVAQRMHLTRDSFENLCAKTLDDSRKFYKCSIFKINPAPLRLFWYGE